MIVPVIRVVNGYGNKSAAIFGGAGYQNPPRRLGKSGLHSIRSRVEPQELIVVSQIAASHRDGLGGDCLGKPDYSWRRKPKSPNPLRMNSDS